MLLFLQPLRVITARKPEFWVFVVTNAFFAQVGLLGSLVLIPLLGDGAFLPLLAAQLRSANFFVFAISLLVTAFSPIILEYVHEQTVHFRSLKVFLGLGLVTLVVVQAFASGIVLTKELAASQRASALESTSTAGGLLSVLCDNWVQILLYFVSISIAIYAFCVTQLHHDMTNYSELDDQERDALVEKTSTQSTASDGLILESEGDKQ